jgi:hypothetical protein
MVETLECLKGAGRLEDESGVVIARHCVGDDECLCA